MMQLTLKLLDWGTRARSSVALLAVLYMFSALASRLSADSDAVAERTEWLQDVPAQRQLHASAEIHWQMTPLRGALHRLARAHCVAIVLDRRVDPDQLISESVVGLDFLSVLQHISVPRGWAVSFVSSVLYVGPEESVRELATWQLRQLDMIQQLDPSWQRRWKSVSDASWPRLTEPRALVEEWLKQDRVPVEGLDQIGHDLWPAQELPPLSLFDRVLIVLAGFDLAPQIQLDGHLKIVRLPRDLTVLKRYRVPSSRRRAFRTVEQQLVDVQATWRAGQFVLDGRAEDHQRVEEWLRGPIRTQRVPQQLKRFTLTVQNQPMAAVMQAVASQLELQLVWLDGTESLRRHQVSLHVENATLGQLMKKILDGQPGEFRIAGDRLIIGASSPVAE